EGIFIEAGPAKHNNSQGFYLYSYEPGGNRIEVYSGSYLVLAPDWQPVTWNEEERAAGVYWGGALPDSFIQSGTPNIEAGPRRRRAEATGLLLISSAGGVPPHAKRGEVSPSYGDGGVEGIRRGAHDPSVRCADTSPTSLGRK